MRYCLAALLIISILSCTRSSKEEAACELVEKLGGQCTRDRHQSGKPVVEVSLRKTSVTASDLKALRVFEHRTTLDLGETTATNAELEEVAALKHVTSLDLGKTNVTDDGLKVVGTMRHL